jgi:hypothetical protein
MTLIRPAATGWRMTAPEKVGDPATLIDRLRAMADGAAVALGIDCPIGLPRAYAASLTATANFPAFLRSLPATGAFWQVAETLEEISPTRPFYPARGVRGMTRLAHATSLGLPDAAALCRACDMATAERPAGAPLFWTLGANQSGKAAISAWRDLFGPALRSATPPALWPFEGHLAALLRPGAIAIAETYPAEALRQLGLVPAGSKRRQSDRAAQAPALQAAMARLHVAPDTAAAATIETGFGADACGEDRFDSFLGALCVLSVATGAREDFVPNDPWITQWEGWVLGQTRLPISLPASHLGDAAQRQPGTQMHNRKRKEVLF